VRYYEREHFGAYARINTEGLQQWSDLVRTLRLAARAEATSSGHLEHSDVDPMAPYCEQFGCTTSTGPATCLPRGCQSRTRVLHPVW